MKLLLLFLYFTNEETKAQRGHETCPRSHSQRGISARTQSYVASHYAILFTVHLARFFLQLQEAGTIFQTTFIALPLLFKQLFENVTVILSSLSPNKNRP